MRALLKQCLDNPRLGKGILDADFTADLSTGFIYTVDGAPYLVHLGAWDALQTYFSQGRPPLNQQQLFWLIHTYCDFVQLIRARDKKPVTSFLINDLVRCFKNGVPGLTVESLEQVRNTMPPDIQRALTQYFGLYKRRSTVR